MKITLSLPPSINSYYSQNKYGRRFKTNEAKQWENDAWVEGLRKCKKYGKCKIEVAYEYYFTTNASDLGNRSKILTDLLQKCGVIDNDNQVWVLHEYKNIDSKKPRVEVEIWRIE